MRWTAAIAAMAVMFLCGGTASAALTPIQVVRQVMMAGPGKMPQTLRCVTTHELQRAAGRLRHSRTIGLTIRTARTSTVLLDWKQVCEPLHRFRTGRRVEPADAIQAMEAILHEKAHVNGERVEWRASCVAIPGVLRQMRRWGFSTRQVDAVKWYLTKAVEKGRTGEYKLRGRCRV